MDSELGDAFPDVEPYRIKVVERIGLRSASERAAILERANYSMPYIDAADVFIDLVTDSGNCAMSDRQWAGMMLGDESYVRSPNYSHFERAVQDVTGYRYAIPTHQGRAAENILMELLVREGDVVLSNAFFDTTRAHVQKRKALALDLVSDAFCDGSSDDAFQGNFDLGKLETALERFHDRVPFILVTVLNNTACSSPVSLRNLREVKRLAERFAKPIFFDGCRFAENAYFIKTRELESAGRSIREIVREVFSHGQGCFVSAKKDGLVNIGGFIALDDAELTRRCQERLVLYEGFPTYGGLASRDLEAMAIGLNEGVEEDYLRSRIAQVAYLGDLLERAGVGVSRPVGGSGVFVDVRAVYPQLAHDQLPEIAFACDVYLEGGVRVGPAASRITGIDARSGELAERSYCFARFAVPRRVYTDRHMRYVAEVVRRVKARAHESRGYRLVDAPSTLGQFFARYARS